MNDTIFSFGNAITRYILDTLPAEYLHSVFSGSINVDDCVDQVILECIKSAFDQTQEKHSMRYYLLDKSGQGLSDDLRMKYSRLIGFSNEYKTREIEFYQQYGALGKEYLPTEMTGINEKLEGYHLTKMNFHELTNIGELDFIKAIANHRIESSKKVSNQRFYDMAIQYDKYVLSLIEQSKESDERMVFNSLAFINIEWKFAFDFIYQCALLMEELDNADWDCVFSGMCVLAGYQDSVSILGIQSTADSRMVGYREGLIRGIAKKEVSLIEYTELLTLVTMITNTAKIDGTPIKQWFVNNTNIHDWASFFQNYNVFRCFSNKKKYTNQRIRNMRKLISKLFPEKRSYDGPYNDAMMEVQLIEEAFQMDKIKCYIEEYQNDEGNLCARLREKTTGRKVEIQGDFLEKQHFLRFLSQAKKHVEIMPTVYDKEGKDSVTLRGTVLKEDEKSIQISIDAPGAGYNYS